MDTLMRQIAEKAADYMIEHHHSNAPKARQIRIWKRQYDSVLAALVVYDEMTRPAALGALSIASRN